MAEIRVYPEGFRTLARRIGGIQLAQVLEPPLVRSLERFRVDLAHYPSPPEESSYRRTGRLGRSWALRYTVNARGIEGETGTNVEYAQRVQSEELQAWMHRDRWDTDETIANRHRGAILADFHQEVQAELNRTAQ